MTTTEAPATNPHQPVREENALRCSAEDCNYSLYVHGVRRFEGMPEAEANFFRSLFRNAHSRQYDPGNAPDISVDWEISACCSVCPDKIGQVETNDSETVICLECKTTWNIDGTGGELDQPEQ